MCELALEMRMPIGELGQRMSLHELAVVWPAYFDVKRKAAEREAAKAKGR